MGLWVLGIAHGVLVLIYQLDSSLGTFLLFLCMGGGDGGVGWVGVAVDMACGRERKGA
ncbi:hypothetical protein QBC41DRAFT_311512 [Cercophora samala]|uniref:Transmembrane protein n=1 Tax=Cercophora samala TaxID=330535 RepID=A0AA40DGF9_9PEZI|nr:hypothetical protein QBC41DRAFT_311512 [Cercophora samala]